MNLDTLLSNLFTNQWTVFLVMAAVLLLFTEVGFRFGFRLHATRDEARKSQVSSIQAAVLGLLGLLLGFTFSMAASRYETRRDIVLQEANSIGTTYLRASFLPNNQPSETRALLRHYVDLRLDFVAAGNDSAALAQVEKDVAAVHHQLWKTTETASLTNRDALTASFVTSLNETIDLDATRLAAFRNQVPASIWLLLTIVAGCGCLVSGYASGSCGKRSAFPLMILPLLLSVVITLIVDLDRPRRGLIEISQQPLLDLKETLANSPD